MDQRIVMGLVGAAIRVVISVVLHLVRRRRRAAENETARSQGRGRKD